jgi:hypothetical protein
MLLDIFVKLVKIYSKKIINSEKCVCNYSICVYYIGILIKICIEDFLQGPCTKYQTFVDIG